MMQLAGFWLRFAAAVVDTLIMLPANVLIELMLSNKPTGLLVSYVLLFWLYYAIFESGPWSATPGKRLLKIRVVTEDNRKLSFWRASGRTFSKYLSGLVLLIGYLMAAWTERKQALHDLLARTLVVKSNPHGIVTPPQAVERTLLNSDPSASSVNVLDNGFVFAGFMSDGHVVRIKVNREDFSKASAGLIFGRDSRVCDLHINDPSVSRQHARLSVESGTLFIEDLASTNGTFVDSEILSPGVRVQLVVEAKLTLGSVTLSVGRI